MSTWRNSFVLSISWLSVGPGQPRHRSFCSCESSENSILITEAVIVPNACTDVRIDQVALSKRSIVWSTCMMAVCSKEWRSCSFAAPARARLAFGGPPQYLHPPPGSLARHQNGGSPPPALNAGTPIRSNVDLQPPVLSLRCSIRYVFHCYKLKKIAKAQMNGACARILQSVQRKAAASHPTDQSFLHPPPLAACFYSHFLFIFPPISIPLI